MMRKLVILLTLLILLLTALPAMADDGYLGSMEIVNCEEWVSLRQSPSTSSRRLVKVSLGAIVSNCRQAGEKWIYAEYDGYSGYILAQYLQPCDNRLTFSAMMITITGDGAPVYATVDSTEPFDVIPPDTIVRNCALMDNDRIYVEWGSRCGFVSMMHAEVYNEMIHHPQQMTMRRNLYGGACEGPDPALQADYAEGFHLMNYAYSEFVQTGTDAPMAEFVLYTDTAVSKVHLFSVSIRTMDADTGEAVLDMTLEHIQPLIDPEHPLAVTAVIWGDTPNLAVGYEDPQGAYHFAFVEISGEDGSLILWEF